MLEFIRLARKRGAIANLLRIMFNVIFVAVTVALVLVFSDTPWPALALLLLSKWRTIAVRPRYWWMNIVSSLPDVAFGAAMVMLMWLSAKNVALIGGWSWLPPVILGLIYVGWLLWLKPRDDKTSVFWQAGLSQFFATMAIFDLAGSLPLAVVMALMFVVAYGTAHQILGQFEEDETTLLSLIYGFIVTVISFAAWHWTVGYSVANIVTIPQVAIIVAALGFAIVTLYNAHVTVGLKWSTVGWPLVICGAMIFLVTIVGGALFI